jgi:hypothetical protein
MEPFDSGSTQAQIEELVAVWRAYPYKLVGPMWLVTRSVACKEAAGTLVKQVN